MYTVYGCLLTANEFLVFYFKNLIIIGATC